MHFLRLKLSPTPAVKYIDGNYLAVHEDEDEDEDGTPPEEKSHVLDVSFWECRRKELPRRLILTAFHM